MIIPRQRRCEWFASCFASSIVSLVLSVHPGQSSRRLGLRDCATCPVVFALSSGRFMRLRYPLPRFSILPLLLSKLDCGSNKILGPVTAWNRFPTVATPALYQEGAETPASIYRGRGSYDGTGVGYGLLFHISRVLLLVLSPMYYYLRRLRFAVILAMGCLSDPACHSLYPLMFYRLSLRLA